MGDESADRPKLARTRLRCQCMRRRERSAGNKAGPMVMLAPHRGGGRGERWERALARSGQRSLRAESGPSASPVWVLRCVKLKEADERIDHLSRR